tara:strand:- start:700 stop:825 length:126 start_codon:yes stop_codon:yes gene_type:complete
VIDKKKAEKFGFGPSEEGRQEQLSTGKASLMNLSGVEMITS